MFNRILTLTAASAIALASTANAGVMTATAVPFTGSNAQVEVELDDMIEGAGNVRIKLTIDQSVAQGDLFGLFMHVVPSSLFDLDPAPFTILSSDPTAVVTRDEFGPEDSWIDLGGGNNINGGGTPGPTDIAFTFGGSGASGGVLQELSFVLTHDAGLSLSNFAEQQFAVRLQSVGDSNGIGAGSSKLIGTFPDPTDPFEPGPGDVPEPTTLAIWSMIGICGLGASRRKRNKKA